MKKFFSAAAVKAPTEVRFEEKYYHYKAVSDGYYSVFITNGKKIIYSSTNDKKRPVL